MVASCLLIQSLGLWIYSSRIVKLFYSIKLLKAKYWTLIIPAYLLHLANFMRSWVHFEVNISQVLFVKPDIFCLNVSEIDGRTCLNCLP